MDDYHAGLEKAVYYPVVDNGLLLIQGEDRVDFLQRQTTNDVAALSPTNSITTILTTPTARILDVLTLTSHDESILGITLPARGETTAAFLHSKIFFIDKVTVEDTGRDWFQIEIEGPQAADLLQSLGASPLGGWGAISFLEVNGISIQAICKPGLSAQHGYILIGPAPQQPQIIAALESASAIQMTPENREILRIEAGSAGHKAELTEEYTPLEVSYQSAISTTKGCYTGQEVIARQVNYDKITKKLTRLELSARAAPGMHLLAAGKSVGKITSVALSPRFGPVALAVIRRPHFEPGTRLDVKTDSGLIPAKVLSANSEILLDG